MLSFLEKNGEIYIEGLRMVEVAEKYPTGEPFPYSKDVDTRRTIDPYWVRLDFEPDAIPGLIEVLQRRYNDSVV